MTNKGIQAWVDNHLDYEGDGCLIWPFARTQSGYAKMGYKGRTWLTTRLICTKIHGEAPAGMEAAHSCHNGSGGCVHPKHLRWATPVENAADREATERHNRGRNNPAAKLTEDDVVSIRYLCEYMPQLHVAKMFGVAKETVFGIYRAGRWPHVTRNHTITERVPVPSV